MGAGQESRDLLQAAGCAGCRTPFPRAITMAFQPIVDVTDGSIFAFEALVRGVDGAGAASVLADVTPDNRFAFDQLCRRTAVEFAARLRIEARLSINFMPNAVYKPDVCLGTTLAAAKRHGFPVERIMFEVTEGERVDDRVHLTHIMAEYRRQGMATAIDDFGAGHSGLNLLAEFQPDVIKLDMDLIRGIDVSQPRQAIVASVARLADTLGMAVVAEGVETEAELAVVRTIGIRLVQGYLLAKPGFERLPEVRLPAPPAKQRAA